MYEAEGQGHKYNLSINRMEDLMVVKTTKRHCYQTQYLVLLSNDAQKLIFDNFDNSDIFSHFVG